MRILPLLAAFFVMASPQSPQQQKYPWQSEGSQCDKYMTFCWLGPENVSDPQVMAWGIRWTTQDKDEKPFEWITEVRCLKDYKLCIVARNQKLHARVPINAFPCWTNPKCCLVLDFAAPWAREVYTPMFFPALNRLVSMKPHHRNLAVADHFRFASRVR